MHILQLESLLTAAFWTAITAHTRWELSTRSQQHRGYINLAELFYQAGKDGERLMESALIRSQAHASAIGPRYSPCRSKGWFWQCFQSWTSGFHIAA